MPSLSCPATSPVALPPVSAHLASLESSAFHSPGPVAQPAVAPSQPTAVHCAPAVLPAPDPPGQATAGATSPTSPVSHKPLDLARAARAHSWPGHYGET